MVIFVVLFPICFLDFFLKRVDPIHLDSSTSSLLDFRFIHMAGPLPYCHSVAKKINDFQAKILIFFIDFSKQAGQTQRVDPMQ